jgi:hypothetical protein
MAKPTIAAWREAEKKAKVKERVGSADLRSVDTLEGLRNDATLGKARYAFFQKLFVLMPKLRLFGVPWHVMVPRDMPKVVHVIRPFPFTHPCEVRELDLGGSLGIYLGSPSANFVWKVCWRGGTE